LRGHRIQKKFYTAVSFFSQPTTATKRKRDRDGETFTARQQKISLLRQGLFLQKTHPNFYYSNLTHLSNAPNFHNLRGLSLEFSKDMPRSPASSFAAAVGERRQQRQGKAAKNPSPNRTKAPCSARVVEAFLGESDDVVIPVAVKAPRRSAGSSEGLKGKAGVEPVSRKPKSPGLKPESPASSFASAVRERRRQRLQGVADREDEGASFKRAYAERRRGAGRSPSKRIGSVPKNT
jgi:hypothetical protein